MILKDDYLRGVCPKNFFIFFMNTSLGDEILVENLVKGDKYAFESIFKKYYAPLLAYGKQYVELADAQENVQDLMLWLWNNRENLYFSTSLKSYLFAAVRNRCLTAIKKEKTKASSFYELSLLSGFAQSSQDLYFEKELKEKIDKAIANLPNSFREAFELNRFENLTYKEIALKLGVSPKTVDYRIQQALKILRKDLRNYLPLLAYFYPMLRI